MPFSSYQIRKIQKKQQKKRLFLFVLLILITGIGIISTVAFSPLFRIQQVIIPEAHFVKISDIYQKINQFLNNQKIFHLISVPPNLLFFSSSDCQLIKQSFAALESVNCQKNFLNRFLKFDLKEREVVGIFCPISTNERCFYFDKEGVIFAPAENKENQKFLIKETGGRIYVLGNKILNENFSSILQIRDFFIDKIFLNSIEINNYDVIYLFDNGFKLLISIQKLKESANLFPKLLENDFTLKNLQYLDMRFLPKLYYK